MNEAEKTDQTKPVRCNANVLRAMAIQFVATGVLVVVLLLLLTML